MRITFDVCPAVETNVVSELFDAYDRCVHNVHMADKLHKPFMGKRPGVN